MKDIQNLEDIKQLVNSFYSKAKSDDLLGPVFNSVIGDWDKHLATMYTFWQTILLNEHTYNGAPFFKHIPLPIHTDHFNRWVDLFTQNINEQFEGEKAEMAKARAQQLGAIFSSKMEYVNAQKNIQQ